jgi:hypothetical protein
MFHEEKVCKKRQVPCGNGCGEYVPLPELQDHKDKYCSHRIVPCQREQCVKQVRETLV